MLTLMHFSNAHSMHVLILIFPLKLSEVNNLRKNEIFIHFLSKSEYVNTFLRLHSLRVALINLKMLLRII